MVAKGVAGVASVGDDPSGYIRQAVEQGNGVPELVGLPRRDPEGYGPTRSVRDDDRLGAIATARAAKRLSRTASRQVAPLVSVRAGPPSAEVTGSASWAALISTIGKCPLAA